MIWSVAQPEPLLSQLVVSLWPPCVADAGIIFLPCDFFFFFSSPNLSRRRLDVYHTSTHGVALEQIYDAGLKRTARGSLEIQDSRCKKRVLGILAISNLQTSEIY